MSCMIESVARNTVDRINVTETMWSGEVLPVVLNGTEVMASKKKTLEELDRIHTRGGGGNLR